MTDETKNVNIDQQADEFAAFIDMFLHPYRDGGAAIRKEAFAKEYNPVERDMKAGSFTTTVYKEDTNKHIFFLHGGAAVLGTNEFFNNTVCALADRGFRVSIYEYPLAPEHNYIEINEAVYGCFREIRELYPDDEFHIWGDSAGVTFGLNLLIRLREENDQKRPLKNVWVSPCVNWDIDNPECRKAAESDDTLVWEVMEACSPKLAPEGNYTDPDVSPLYADLRGLGGCYVTYSSKEMFWPDDVKFVEKLNGSEGTNVDKIYVCEGLFHDYVLQTDALPEAIKALDEIAEYLSN